MLRPGRTGSSPVINRYVPDIKRNARNFNGTAAAGGLRRPGCRWVGEGRPGSCRPSDLPVAVLVLLARAAGARRVARRAGEGRSGAQRRTATAAAAAPAHR